MRGARVKILLTFVMMKDVTGTPGSIGLNFYPLIKVTEMDPFVRNHCGYKTFAVTFVDMSE